MRRKDVKYHSKYTFCMNKKKENTIGFTRRVLDSLVEKKCGKSLVRRHYKRPARKDCPSHHGNGSGGSSGPPHPPSLDDQPKLRVEPEGALGAGTKEALGGDFKPSFYEAVRNKGKAS